MSVVPLAAAGPACGGKAAALAVLSRAGLPVPDGFVVTDPATDPGLIGAALDRLGGRPVAVRSSGLAEDSATASFAGQLDTVLGARGLAEVLAAIDRCAASGHTERALAYRARLGLDERGATPVLVQALVEADQAGVLFTRDPRGDAGAVVINAAWGLGQPVVSGMVVPDEIVVTGTVRVTVGAKHIRLDLRAHGLAETPVPAADRARACLSGEEITRLVALGRRCEELLDRPQDVEWACRDGEIWLLQSRPITALAAPAQPASVSPPALVTGVPSSPGRVRGPARLVRSVDDFHRVRRGDVLVCRTTDPAWTPLFRVAAGVVTETGGVLCHAAIVAREYGIPAVVGAAGALARLPDGAPVTVDGALGTVTAARTDPEGAPDGPPVTP